MGYIASVVVLLEDEEWAEETTEEVGEIEQQLSTVTVSSNNSEKSHEEKLEFFYNLLEVSEVLPWLPLTRYPSRVTRVTPHVT